MTKTPKKPNPGQKRSAARKPGTPQGPNRSGAKPQAPVQTQPNKPASKGPGKKPGGGAPAGKNQSTKSAKSNCPAVQRHPCDVKSMKLSVTPRKRADSTDKPEPVEITIPKALRIAARQSYASLKPLVGHERAMLLQKYDVVIETLAGFFQGGTPETTIDVTWEAQFEGKCPTHQHPRLVTDVHTTPGRQIVELNPKAPPHPQKLVPTRVTWPVGTSKATMEGIQALTLEQDLLGSDAVATLLRIVSFLFSWNKSVDLEYWATGHGVPVDPHKTQGNRYLVGLVRVFRDLSVSIALNIPLGQKISETQGREWGGNIDRKREQQLFLAAKKREATQWQNHRKFTYGPFEELEKSQWGLAVKFNEIELVLKEGGKSPKEQWAATKQRYMAARRGVKRQVLETQLQWELRHFLTLADHIQVVWQRLVGGIRSVRQKLKTLVDACKKAPQLGWKLEYEFSFLAAALSLTGTRKSSSKVIANRCVKLEPSGKVTAELTVVEIKLTLSFGFLLEFPGLKLELRVYGSVAGAVKTSFELPIPLGGDKKLGLEGKATGTLGAVAHAQVLWKVLRYEIAIEMGVVVEGGFTWKPADKKTEWELKVRSLPVQWRWVATNARTGEVHPRYYKLLDPQTFYHGQDAWNWTK
jgi:hypothetical protein